MKGEAMVVRTYVYQQVAAAPAAAHRTQHSGLRIQTFRDLAGAIESKSA